MADNVSINDRTGTAVAIASDDIGGVEWQRVKIGVGDDGSAQDVSANNPMPIQVLGEAIEAIESMRMAVQALTRTLGQMHPDTAARMRVAIDAISASLTLATITTVSTVTTVSALTNVTQIGGIAATEQVPSLMRLGADSMRRNITVS